MKKKYAITIFTPTYNRAYIIEILYKSLKRQSFKDFEWIIYDDGSSDNTEDVIQKFIDEDILDIKFIKAINRGKHVAINEGVDIAKGELFFIVDSDDFLLDDSIELVMGAWNSIDKNERKNFAGVGGRRRISGESKEFNFSTEYLDATLSDFSLVYNNMQDKAEVYVTDVLKKYKFPSFENENFMTEVVVWYAMSDDSYKLRWFNKDIYECEYLDDGLSNNFYKRRIESINGTCYSYNKLASFNLPFKYKLRYKINYYRYGLTKFKLSELNKALFDRKFKCIAAILGMALKMKDSKNLR